MTVKSNILVISDLHLGEDLSVSANETTSKNLAVLERQLIQFLRHYTRRRHDGQPWRLVVNGDMVDFLTICVLPGERGLDLDRVTPGEHVYGLGRRPKVARAKMEAVIDRHDEVFRAMARFVAVGNSIEIIAGNHDTEFHFPAVQDAFKDGVARMFESLKNGRNGGPTAEMIRDRIRFHRWFFYEPGVAWIEHGHQYDECSSVENVLEPMRSEQELATNVDVAGLRYVANQIDDAEQHALAEWNFAGYIKFSFSLGLRGLGRIAKGYFLFVASLIGAWWNYRPTSKAHRARRQLHMDRMRELGTSFQLSESSLRAIDDLRRRPVVSNLRRLCSVLMVDTLVINGLGILGVIVALLALPWLAGIPMALALFGISRLAALYAQKKRLVDPEVVLGLMPERILRHVDARFVIFGHTHEPVAQELEGGGWYYNTGTWVPAGRPGLLRAFTHVVIRNREDGPTAALCQWRDGDSRPFAAGEAPLVARPVAGPLPIIPPAAVPAGVRAQPSARLGTEPGADPEPSVQAA